MPSRVFGRSARLGLSGLLAGLLLVGFGGGTAGHFGAATVLARTVYQPDDDKGYVPPVKAPAKPSPPPGVATTASPAPPDKQSNGITRVAPHLEAVEPSGDRVPVSAGIVLTFSEPMNRSSVERSLAIKPAPVGGQPVWGDDFTLRLQPDRLEHGTAYRIEVGGRSVRGAALDGQRTWQFTTVAAPPIVIAPGPNAVKVPILMYHYVRVVTDPGDRLGFALSVTPADFAAQMDWLAANGFHPITLTDLNDYLNGVRGLPSRPVILTFDDGYADFYGAALPVLRQHDFKSVAYVVSGFIGRPGYMSAAEVAQADRAGVEIGSHTVDHADLTRQSAASLAYQVTASKQSLEALLGHPVLSFCYPSGRFNGGVTGAVQAAGYRDATTTQVGFVHTLGDRYAWSRVRISGGESLQRYAEALIGAS